MLDRAAQRTRAVLLVVALLDEQLLGLNRELEGDLPLDQALGEFRDLEVHDLHEVGLLQRPEEDDVGNAVQELGLEDALGLLEHLLAHLLRIGEAGRRGGKAHRGLALQELRADVGGHDDDRVPEVDGAPQRIGQPAVLEDLQEELQDIRMGLLHLVKEDDGVGTAADGLGQLAALLVAHVARGRADQPGDSELLHVLRHVDLDEGVLVAEHLGGKLLGGLGLADTGGSHEEEGADRATRVLEVGPRAAQGARDRVGGDLLADDRLLDFLFQVEELLALLLLEPGERDAGPVGDDLHHEFLVDGDPLLLPRLLPLLGHLLLLGAQLLLGVAELRGLLEMLLADGLLLLRAHLLDLLYEVLDVGRTAERGDAGTGARLVHDVDRLVRQEAARDVAVGKLDGGLEGEVREGRLVVILVLAADPLQDRDRVLDARRLDLDRLESAVEGAVLLDVLAVLVEGGRAHALQFTAGKRGLEDIGGVHGALGRSGANDRVHLVDEQDDVLRPLDLVHDGLDALLELAAVLGARHHEGEVQGDDLLLEEDLGDVAGGDFLGQALDDRRLAHARLADQDRVVLRPAAQDLDHPANLVLAAHDGVHLALLSQFGQVAAKGLQGGGLDFLLVLGRGARALGIARRGLVAAGLAAGELRIKLAQDLVSGALDVDLEGLEDAGGDALALPEEPEQDMLGANVGMIEGLRLLARQGEDLLHARGVRNAALGLGLLPGAHLLLDGRADRLKVQPHLLQDAHGDALPELDKPQEDVLGADVVVVKTIGFLAREREDLLGPRREVVHRFL